MRTTLVVPLAFFAAAALATAAHAAPGYLDGIMQSNSDACVAAGISPEVTRAVAGYFANPGYGVPQTGAVSYIHALTNNVNACSKIDINGFDFFLPPDTALAISAATPVICRRGKLDGSFEEAVPNDANGACLQVAQTGNSGGLFFGYSKMPPGWWLDIRVPVVFNRALVASQHSVAVTVSSAYGNLHPFKEISVTLIAQFTGLATANIGATQADVLFNLFNFFTPGPLTVEFGTSPSLGTTTPSSLASASTVSAPVSARLSNLSPGTTYFWRAHYAYSTGAWVSAIQSFVTAPTFALSVSTSGAGYGSVTSSPSGIACGFATANLCSAMFPWGTSVTLTATSPSLASVFTGWGGACSGVGTCTVSLTYQQAVVANFAPLAPEPLPPGGPRPRPRF